MNLYHFIGNYPDFLCIYPLARITLPGRSRIFFYQLHPFLINVYIVETEAESILGFLIREGQTGLLYGVSPLTLSLNLFQMIFSSRRQLVGKLHPSSTGCLKKS